MAVVAVFSIGRIGVVVSHAHVVHEAMCILWEQVRESSLFGVPDELSLLGGVAFHLFVMPCETEQLRDIIALGFLGLSGLRELLHESMFSCKCEQVTTYLVWVR